MKNLKLMMVMLFALVMTSVSYAQDVIDTYEMSYFESKPTYNISASEVEDGKTSFYIYAASADRYSDAVALIIKSEQLEKLKSVIDSAKVTYENWVKTAKENNVTELDKEISIDKVTFKCGFFTSSWHFDYSVQLTSRFKILSSGECVLILENKSKLVSGSNKYIDSDGFFMVFTSSDEIDSFLSKLTLESVNAHYEKKSSKEDLFKD